MTTVINPNERHQAFHLAMVEQMRKFPDITPIEMLCIASQFVGQLLAHQDQRVHTVPKLMKTIELNIRIGNRAAVETAFSGIDESKRN